MTTLDRARSALRAHQPTAVTRAGTIPAAVAVLLLDGADGLETLFIRRAERAGDTWSGQIAFPGGRQEAADRDLLATAIRETREEIGVDLSTAELLGALDDLHPRTPVLPPVVVRPFVFGLTARPALMIGAEVQDAFWVPVSTLTARSVRREVRLHVRDVERTVTAYVIGDRTIWGMTERILTPFLELLEPRV